jgi:hypothetical protein
MKKIVSNLYTDRKPQHLGAFTKKEFSKNYITVAAGTNAVKTSI